MRVLRILCLLGFLLLACTACIHDSEFTLHRDQVSPGDVSFTVVDGPNIVLEAARFDGRVLTDRAKAYNLWVEIVPALVVEGRLLEIPSPGVKAYLWTLDAPVERQTNSCRGTLRIEHVSATTIEARIDVRPDDAAVVKGVRGRFQFVRAAAARGGPPAQFPQDQ